MAEVDPKKASSIYEFTVTDIDGNEVSLEKYKGKQYAGLEELYQKYKDQGLAILGFPCNQFGSQEPGTEQEIKEFCSLKYNVTFDLFQKINVNGSSAAPLWVFLKSQQHGFLVDAIKWNFTKFLIDKQGKPVKRYGSNEDPSTMTKEIEGLLAAQSD